MTDEEKRQTWRGDFAAKNGPDFKSRLAGYINVLGPNRNSSRAVDLTWPVRRALLLRVQLGLKPSETLNIDHGLLEASLRIEKYHHGARSLDEIAEQERHSSRNGVFTRSDVPPADQLGVLANCGQVVSGSWDKTVRLWEARTGRGLLRLKGHTDRVWSVRSRRMVGRSSLGTVTRQCDDGTRGRGPKYDGWWDIGTILTVWRSRRTAVRSSRWQALTVYQSTRQCGYGM